MGAVDTLDVLINNAGIALYDDLRDLDVLPSDGFFERDASHFLSA